MQNMPLTSEIFTRKLNRSFEVCVYTYYMYLQNQFLYFDGTPPEHDMQVKNIRNNEYKTYLCHIEILRNRNNQKAKTQALRLTKDSG